ncbi:MAG: DUF956 family protein [Lachnospiraceae bacterium]|nr:DUF956 family protein [Lachnospiraceae bacterium]MEE3462043.1 DUF956 family protein [Lachnospiraceae bacterium]
MVQSMNTKVDYTCKATSFAGLTNYGKIMVGDKAFEYYNDANVNDYIQIPWDEISYISASVYFNKHISRFAIFLKQNKQRYFSFSARDNKAVLRACREHFPAEKIQRSPSFIESLSRGFMSIFGINKFGNKRKKR